MPNKSDNKTEILCEESYIPKMPNGIKEWANVVSNITFVA